MIHAHSLFVQTTVLAARRSAALAAGGLVVAPSCSTPGLAVFLPGLWWPVADELAAGGGAGGAGAGACKCAACRRVVAAGATRRGDCGAGGWPRPWRSGLG